MGAASNRLEDTVSGANMALTMPRASVHWYGKEQCRKGRKMGHINLTANSQGELFADLLPLLDMEGIPRESVLRPTTALLSTTMPYYLPTLSMSPPPLVAVIMGSQSDLPTMQGAVDILKQFDIPHQVDIVSAHRTPDKLVQYAKTAESRGLRVIIAGAGGAAHLPGMVASLTPLPVIGVPVMTSTLHGVDSLYSIVQMPKGIPVATVAIGNAPNAALLAVRILSTSRLDLRRKLQQYQHDLEHMVEESSMQLLRLGTDEFLQLPKL
jgi:phosphoribosylaminoimidazole carboxylase